MQTEQKAFKNIYKIHESIKNWASKPKLNSYLHQTYRADSLTSQKLQGVRCCPHLLPVLLTQEAPQFLLVLSCKVRQGVKRKLRMKQYCHSKTEFFLEILI